MIGAAIGAPEGEGEVKEAVLRVLARAGAARAATQHPRRERARGRERDRSRGEIRDSWKRSASGLLGRLPPAAVGRNPRAVTRGDDADRGADWFSKVSPAI